MKIIQYPDKRLMQKALDVSSDEIRSDELNDFINSMIACMKDRSGLGLSACQVGSDKNIFVCRLKKEGIVIAINPRVLGRSGNYWSRKEGCLSLPGKRRDIKRSKTIIIKFLDQTEKEHTLKKEKFEGAIIQHEMDHLKGKLIIDY